MEDGAHIVAERWGLKVIGCPEYKGTFSIVSI